LAAKFHYLDVQDYFEVLSESLTPPVGKIEDRVYLVRGREVVLHTDLAAIFLAPPRALMQAVKRNADCFPEHFMFRLTMKEAEAIRPELTAVSRRNCHDHPYAFTERGVAMLSSILSGERAARMSIIVLGAVLKLHKLLTGNGELARSFYTVEKTLQDPEAALDHVVEDIERLAKCAAMELCQADRAACQTTSRRRFDITRHPMINN
jgi:hypothetical protein